MNGGVAKDNLAEENLDALRAGSSNLIRHIENVAKFGVPSVVAINRFPTDTDAELELLNKICEEYGVRLFCLKSVKRVMLTLSHYMISIYQLRRRWKR